MATNTNLDSFDYQTGALPGQYFNNIFKNTIALTGDVVEAVETFFEIITKNRASAKVLASAIIVTAKSQNQDPLTLVQEFKKLNPGQINAYLATYLNLNRIPTSLLGTVNKPPVNQFVERTILL